MAHTSETWNTAYACLDYRTWKRKPSRTWKHKCSCPTSLFSCVISLLRQTHANAVRVFVVQVGRAKTAANHGLQGSLSSSAARANGHGGHGSHSARRVATRASLGDSGSKGGFRGGPAREAREERGARGAREALAAQTASLDPWPLPCPPSLQGPVGV